jgi:uncharacterized protein
MSPGQAALIALLAAVAASTQALTGFGFALLIVPPLAVVIGPKEAVVVTTLLGSMVNLGRLTSTGRHVAWPTARRFVAGALVGLPIGSVILDRVDDGVLQAVIALSVAGFAIPMSRGAALRTKGLAADLTAGLVSGIGNTATGMSGPPLVITLHGRDIEPDQFRATLSVVFVTMGALSLGLFAASGRLTQDRLVEAGVGLPGVIVGFVVGELAFRHVDGARFRQLVVAMLFASACLALITLAF